MKVSSERPYEDRQHVGVGSESKGWPVVIG